MTEAGSGPLPETDRANEASATAESAVAIAVAEGATAEIGTGIKTGRGTVAATETPGKTRATDVTEARADGRVAARTAVGEARAGTGGRLVGDEMTGARRASPRTELTAVPA